MTKSLTLRSERIDRQMNCCRCACCGRRDVEKDEMNEKNPASIYLLLLMCVRHHMQRTSSYLRLGMVRVWSGSGSVFVSPDPIRHSSVFFLSDWMGFRLIFHPLRNCVYLVLDVDACLQPASSVGQESLMECWG
jgi:hypothetical protein